MLYAAVLDACVLVPGNLRHVLLRVAAEGVYRPLWTDRIWAETRGAVERRFGAETLEVFDGLSAKIQATFDDATVAGWEPLEAAMTNHPKDRHVLADAVAGRADAIVSDNVRDFPPASLVGHGLELHTADEFLLNQLDLAPDAVGRAIAACAATTTRPGQPAAAPRDWLGALAASAPEFAAEARALW
jgi:hypothetical protein